MLEFLKTHTQEIHKAVEASNPSKFILDHSITIQQYKELLLYNYSAYKIIEQELYEKKDLVAPELRFFISTNKSERLLKDIKGIDPLLSLDLDPNRTFSVSSRLEIIGALYVIEGSMLGGLIINKHLRACKALVTIKRHHFFSDDAKAITSRWKAFINVVNAQNFSTKEKELALLSAKKVFTLFSLKKREFKSLFRL